MSLRKTILCAICFVFNVNFEYVFPYCHCTNNELSIAHFSSNRRSQRKCSVRKGVLRNFAKLTRKHPCQSLFFNKGARACNFIKKETVAQLFSCEFCEISTSTIFTEHLRATASLVRKLRICSHLLKKSLMENLCHIFHQMTMCH